MGGKVGLQLPSLGPDTQEKILRKGGGVQRWGGWGSTGQQSTGWPPKQSSVYKRDRHQENPELKCSAELALEFERPNAEIVCGAIPSQP